MAELKGQFGIAGMEDDGAAGYQAFVDKFKPKLTTDDVHIASLKRIATGHIAYSLPWKEVRFVRRLDAQKELNKSIFGGGFLVTERAAAERNPAIVFELSPREREIVATLGEEVRP